MNKMTEDRLDEIRQSPRHADVTDVEDLADEVLRCWSEIYRLRSIAINDATFLRSLAQNDYMIDQHYLPDGERLNRLADTLEGK